MEDAGQAGDVAPYAPTDADRAKAAEVHIAWLNDQVDTPLSTFIAAALTAERAAADWRLVHLKQAGAMAAFAEQLEQEGEPRAAVMADQLAEFYRQWAENPDVVPPEIEAPPERAAAVADLRARVEAGAEELAIDGWHMDRATIVGRLRAAVTDPTGQVARNDDGCQPDCDPTNLHQVASDEAECTVCGYRRPLGDE